jgi:hypothetical protein
MRYAKRLTKIADLSEAVERDANFYDLKVDRSIETLKANFFNQSINNLLDEHLTNIDGLNKLLSSAFNISLTNEMVDSSQDLIDEFVEVIKSNHIMFNRSGLSYNLLDNTKHKLFFGDNPTLELLINIINEKLKENKNLTKRFSTENKSENLYPPTTDKLLRPPSSNPFAGKEKKINVMTYYNESIVKHTQDLNDNLNNIIMLLNNRRRLNDILLPIFIRYESSQHEQLVL